MSAVPLPLRQAGRAWSWAQLAGLLLTVTLVVGLVVAPAASLDILWNAVIPVLPAVFLVNPMLWRNVCPLATLNAATGEHGRRRTQSQKITRRWWTAGIILLFVLVPARRFLFNDNGLAMAITIGVVAVVALATGMRYARRAGFCNAFCPVLPVEKLYGHSPLVETGNARCASCTVCTPVGCIDLAERKTIPQTVGPMRRDRAWIGTPFGIFALTFPGFVVGYFTLENGPLSSAPVAYAHVVIYMLVSYALFAGITDVWNLTPVRVLPILAGTAFMLYYWFSAASIATTYSLGTAGTVAIRVAAAALLAFWTYRNVLDRGRLLREWASPGA